ncbi:hypothetical protein B0H14DRAFT_2605938 [Mycena olivaceomarginata]|nr:hypothetical protein B0H14DRAFT_2605938 [Mycena olivaceomarginata]
MNDTFVSTDLPEDSPFKVIPADGQRESFAGYPYLEGYRWPQTFKITEIEQIRRRKQTVACFFCRSRKIACTPRPVDEMDDKPCGTSLTGQVGRAKSVARRDESRALFRENFTT